MDKSLHVFVCSTYRDLVSERNAVLDGLEGLTDQFASLTFYCPRSIQSLDVAKDEISRSDVLILIMGHLHGVIAPGLDTPHAEAEYAEGVASGKRILVYLRDPDSGMHPAHFERDPARAAQLKAFRDKIEATHGAKVFDDIYSLVSMVTHDLWRLAQDSGLKPKSGPKTVKFKAKASETRKIPMGVSLLPQSQTPDGRASATTTIPILQKALATPFRRRNRSGGRLPRVLSFGAVGLALLALAAVKLKGTPILRSVPYRAENAEGQSSQALAAQPSAEAPVGAMAAAPKPEAPPKPSGIVAVTDDEDPTKAFLRKATQGSAADQYKAGEMYENGKDVHRNDSIALKWYKRAADQGMAEAQYKVGMMYRWGKGTKKSSYAAAHWIQSAAEQGHPRAQVALGQMYKTGKGVPKDETAAFKWFLKAADQKDPEAEKILADLKRN
ncbi:MAG: SEL1-like repeat protein [Fibrobacteres bacterium]|nr:SEL1-like repeat protein [Fibrobacterota bacterium]